MSKVTNEQHRGSYTKLYSTWRSMIKRCECTSNAQYANYGARGIQVCGRWRMSFAAFRDDVGEKPSPRHSLDRINNDGNYEPGNVRWATQSEQFRNKRDNRRLTHAGLTLCVTEWAERLGVSRRLLSVRLARGWSVKRTLETGLR